MRERLLRLALRSFFKPFVGPHRSIAAQRRTVARLSHTNMAARDVQREAASLGGVPVEIITPKSGPSQGDLLYVHGGAYILGSPATHRAITSWIASLGRLRVVVPDYRLAPEHPYPAGLEDAVAVWEALVGSDGRCALAGDSAGAGLALCLALRLRDEGRSEPHTLVLLSPWVDMRLDAPSVEAMAARDPMLSKAWLQQAVDAYIGASSDASDARWSPLLADLAGLPRTLIHAGSDEILLDDAQQLAARLRDAKVPVELQTFDGLWHDFHMHAAVLPRARAAVQALGNFLAEKGQGDVA